MTGEKKKLGEILMEKGVIDRHQLRAALDRQKTFDKKIGETLLDLNFLTEQALTAVLSEYFRVPAIEVDKITSEHQALVLVKAEFCVKHDVVPIALRKIKGSTRLVVVSADPSDISALDELRFMANFPIAVGVANLSAVRKAIQKAYHGKKIPDRDEITITTTVRPEDAVMEIIRAGDQEKIFMEPSRSLSTVDQQFQRLVRMLLNKGTLTQEEVTQIFS